MAWKRKVEELESDNKSLSDLLDAIRSGDQVQVDNLIALIRTHQASQSEVVDYVATNFVKTTPAEEPDDRQSKASTRQQSPSTQQTRLPRSIRNSLRTPISVPATPWTSVTDDDDLVSHLVSLWFTWRHWCYPFIDRDAFVSAMQSGNLENGLCTPYLVNMILADACFDYDTPDSMNSPPLNEKSLRDLFFEEARRHMDSAKRKRSLTAIQYLGIQWMYFGNSGLDTMSIAVMHEVVHHLKQLDRPGREDKWKARLSTEQATRVEKMLGYTTWATFVSTTAATFAMRNDPLMRPPSREKPPLCEGVHGEHWFPYPRRQPSVVAHSACHLHFLGRLFEICYNISEYLFTKDDKKTFTQDVLQDLQTDLALWYESLIGCLNIVDNIKSPHTLSIHAQYHWAIMVIAELSFGSRIEVEDDATVALFVPVVQAQHMAAALTIADLVHRQCIHWGVDHVPTSFLQPINAALAVVTNDLEPAEHKSAFIKLAIGLHSLSRRSVSAESILRMLRLKLRQKRLMSSGDIDRLFEDADDHWEESLWVPQGTAVTNILSVSGREKVSGDDDPMDFHANVDGGRAVQHGGGGTVDENYDLLIEKWNHFNLGASSSSSSSSS